MRRGLRAYAALLLVAAAPLVGCGGDDEDDGGGSAAAGAAQAEVKPPDGLVAPGRLTIAADFQGPPFDYIEGSDKKGFDVEFDKRAAELMGLEVELVDTRFASLVPGLEAGRFDAVISVLYITQERAQSIDMVPYAQTGSGFLVKRDGDFQPERPEDLCGRTVAVLAGGFEEQAASGEIQEDCRADGKPIEVKSFPTDVEATQDVGAGRADVFFTNHSIVGYRAEQFPELGLGASNAAPLFPVPAGIGIRKDRPDVKRAFEEVVEKLQASGELEDLLGRYGLELPDPELVEKALGGESS